MIKLILLSMRPKQWTKNLVVFAGIIFAMKLTEPIFFLRTVMAFFLFCLVSGSLYLINDIVDKKQDQQHPKKRLRPIASNQLSVSAAGFTASIILVFACTWAFLLSTIFGLCLLFYLFMMLTYSFFLKHIVILDILVIALGFVLRAYAGVVVHPGLTASKWLLMCAFFLALFLIISKRRHELILLDDKANEHRQVLLEYSPGFLDQMVAIVTSMTVFSYALYTISRETIEKFHTHSLILTFPFVLFGILRYLYLVYKRGQGGEPEIILLQDKPLLINILFWLILVIIIIYNPTPFDQFLHLGTD
ncbi:MAG: decaprenyl-phosphate phosphoribosyltransferase [bacterium]|nr:decaprenyl-phosphate phosphoribosyltransferase [bacterium]